ncbi:hypothetical protein Xoosp13_51 [Xanthomonas phage Xoo-sp13]|nr:hypothetical protein Xoosp13_51 [Xanthomonas phage Xoo-sp13]
MNSPLLTYVLYPSVHEMEPKVRGAVKKMGLKDDCGQLIDVAKGKISIQYGAIVLFEDDRPVGWAACYSKPTSTTSNPIEYSAMSVWVNIKDRCKGYGYQLTTLAYRYWYQKYDPDTFRRVNDWWYKKEQASLRRRANKS